MTIDHYYQVEGIVHSYTVELRDLGEYAFELPPEFILPTATETWNGLKAMTDEILKTQYTRVMNALLKSRKDMTIIYIVNDS